MTDLSNKRIELLLLQNRDVNSRLTLGNDSSLKKFTAFTSKLKQIALMDSDFSSLISEVTKINFSKYQDEVGRVIGGEIRPKSTKGILSLFEIIILLKLVYPDSFSVFFETFKKRQYDEFYSELKLNGEPLNKGIIKFIIEGFLLEMKEFEPLLKNIFQLCIQPDRVIYAYRTVLGIAKYLVKIDSTLLKRSEISNFFNMYLDNFVSSLVGFQKNLFSLIKKSKVLFETKGDLSEAQSEEYFNHSQLYQKYLQQYLDLVSILGVSPINYKWDIEEPDIENGKIVFIDTTVKEDDIDQAFESIEEKNFYTNLQFTSTFNDRANHSLEFYLVELKNISKKVDLDLLSQSFLFSDVKLPSDKEFAESLIEILKSRAEQTSYVCRFIALVKQKYPKVADYASNSAFGQCMFLIHKKLPIVGMRSRMVKIVSDLVKFSLMSQSDVFVLFRRMCDNLDSNNVDFLSQLMASIGKYLYYSPESRKRIEYLIRLLRKKNGTLLPSDSASIDGAIRCVIGSDDLEIITECSLESMYLASLLKKHLLFSKECIFNELSDICSSSRADFLIKEFFDGRGLCELQTEWIINFFQFTYDNNRAVFFDISDCYFHRLDTEISRFPFLDRQLVIRSLEIFYCLAEHRMISLLEFDNCMTYLFRKEIPENLHNDWINLLIWILESFLINDTHRRISMNSIPSFLFIATKIASQSYSIDKLNAELQSFININGLKFICSSQCDSKRASIEAPDSIDSVIDDHLSRMATSACEERKVFSRVKEESFVCLGPQSKQEHKILLIRPKGKRSHDLREIKS